MKVYVVTSGCYSDYRINEVFLDKEKAELYCKYHSGCYDDYRVEEYDTADDYEPEEKLVKVTGRFHIFKGMNNAYSSPICKYLQSGLLDNNEFYYKDQQTLTNYGDKYELFIARYYNEDNISEEQAKDKVEKIGYDLCNRIIALRHEGLEFDDIKEMIEDEK